MFFGTFTNANEASQYLMRIGAPLIKDVVIVKQSQWDAYVFDVHIGFPIDKLIKYSVPTETIHINYFYKHCIEILGFIRQELEKKFPAAGFGVWLKDKFGVPKLWMPLSSDPEPSQVKMSHFDLFVGRFWKNYHDFISYNVEEILLDCTCHQCTKKKWFIQQKEIMKQYQTNPYVPFQVSSEQALSKQAPNEVVPFSMYGKFQKSEPYTYTPELGTTVGNSLCRALPDLYKITVQCPYYFETELPTDTEEIARERCSLNATIMEVVIHLNDSHKWTREAVADWTDSLDADLEFKPESERKKERKKTSKLPAPVLYAQDELGEFLKKAIQMHVDQQFLDDLNYKSLWVGKPFPTEEEGKK